MTRRQSLGTRTSGPLENTASADPPPTLTVRQSATTRGSGPLKNTASAVPPPTSPRLPLRRGGRHLCSPLLRRGGRHLCSPPLRRGRRQPDWVRFPPSLRAGRDKGAGRQAPGSALPPPGQTSRLQVLRRRGLQAVPPSRGRQVQGCPDHVRRTSRCVRP